MYKQGWYKPQESFQEMYREVRRYALSLYPDVDIPTECYMSNRMGGKSYGRYLYTYCYQYNKYGYKERIVVDDAIVFSDIALRVSKNSQLNVIIHEIAHCVADKHCKYNCKHDDNWEAVGNKIGQAFGEEVHHHVHEADVKELMKERKRASIYRYQLVCEKCGTICAKYKSKPRVRWQHTKDGGMLIVKEIIK